MSGVLKVLIFVTSGWQDMELLIVVAGCHEHGREEYDMSRMVRNIGRQKSETNV